MIQHDLYRNGGKKVGIAPLVDEGAHEGSTLELVENFWRDAAADVDTANRLAPERQIARLSAVNRSEQIQRFDADFTVAGQGRLRDHGAGVNRRGDFFFEPAGLLQPFVFSEKIIDVEQPGARKHPFITCMAEFFQQITQQTNLRVIARGEIGVATLRRRRMIVSTIVIKIGFSEPRSRRDQRFVAGSPDRTFIEANNFSRFERENPVGGGFKIVQQ